MELQLSESASALEDEANSSANYGSGSVSNVTLAVLAVRCVVKVLRSPGGRAITLDHGEFWRTSVVDVVGLFGLGGGIGSDSLLLRDTLKESLSCSQIFGGNSEAADLGSLAALVKALFQTVLVHQGQSGSSALLAEAERILRRHYRLGSILDKEGGLFGVGSSGSGGAGSAVTGGKAGAGGDGGFGAGFGALGGLGASGASANGDMTKAAAATAAQSQSTGLSVYRELQLLKESLDEKTAATAERLLSYKGSVSYAEEDAAAEATEARAGIYTAKGKRNKGGAVEQAAQADARAGAGVLAGLPAFPALRPVLSRSSRTTVDVRP